jgi:hypothetical protein
MADHVIIPARFSGPPQAANGGYACGTVARLLGGGDAEVTLRRPLHLDVPIPVLLHGPDQIELHDDGALAAEGVARTVDAPVPPPVGLAAAELAATAYRGFEPGGTYPYCFVCGPARQDGLRIFAGPVAGTDLVAAPWVPDASVTDPDGTVPHEIVWASLDCPSFFAAAESGVVALLGRMAGRIHAEVRGGQAHVVVAMRVAVEGRKRIGASALYTADGELCASSLATWITIGEGGFPSP